MAANKNPRGKTAQHGKELAQRSRAALLNALGVLEKRGKYISELLADEIEQNPSKFIDLAAKLIPKEVEANITTTSSKVEDLSDAELESLRSLATSIISQSGIAEQDEQQGISDPVH